MPPLQRPALRLALLFAAGLPLACGPRAAAEPAPAFRATVLSVGDGDTLRVRADGQPITIRLACIDAPEMAQSPWGERSHAYLRQRLPLGEEVSVLPHTIDRYGRTVAEVIRGVSINLALVEDGQAFAYRRYLGGCDARDYLDAEVRASRHRLGVWQVEGGITRPWDFRRSHRGTTVPDGTTPGGHRPSREPYSAAIRAQQTIALQTELQRPKPL